MIPTRLAGKFRLTRRLGACGMGTVYLARDLAARARRGDQDPDRACPRPPDGAATDATLSALVLSDGASEVTLTPAFDSATRSYAATVANSVASVTVTPTVTDPNATVTVNGAAVASGSPSAAIELEVGETVIEAVVTAEDGTTTSTHTVTVMRATAVPALPLGGALLLGVLLVCLGAQSLLQPRNL